MVNELFPFQRIAVEELRNKAALAISNYSAVHVPQVISLQAPTGSGKTIIMASFMEDIYYGSEKYPEQPDAIFVWLSDSPQLNEQSRQKIDQKADKIRMDQCVMISDDSFDQEYLDDRHIYFLNTQKLGKAGNLSRHSDTRQYTIWETIENTAREKADRLYFIIDEAHRGMQGKEAGKATTIMQRFIKGSPALKLSPVPVVIGMSATAQRFNALVGDTNSTLQKVVVTAAQVRSSGLLKDRIIIVYPEDPEKHNDMSILQAATDEWIKKCQHWYQYTSLQHYSNVNPVFVIQVTAGTGKKVSDTDLNDVVAKVEERLGRNFSEGEVVHTFGSTGTLDLNGLNVPHVEPADIADNKKICLVLFKENLSTGWDCPRAETMMSFRRAEDATYIAQLLGRMIRTPLQSHIMVDDSLNEVRLFLPNFNKDTVKDVIGELENSEGGDLPTYIGDESIEDQVYTSWSVHTGRSRKVIQIPGQMNLEDYFNNLKDNRENTGKEYSGGEAKLPTGNQKTPGSPDSEQKTQDQPAAASDIQGRAGDENGSQSAERSQCREIVIPPVLKPNNENAVGQGQYEQMSFVHTIDREKIIKFINDQGYLTYMVRNIRINTYLSSLLSLAGLLTQTMICQGATDEVKTEVTDLIRNYIIRLKKSGKYKELVKHVLEFKLSMQVFDVFGDRIRDYDYAMKDLFATAESDLDRQLRYAEAKLGGGGFTIAYGRRFYDPDDPNAFKIDCILYAADDECMKELNLYAEKKFHELNDKYRKYIVSKSEKYKKQYSDIIANGDRISKHNFTLPETINVRLDKDGKTYKDHLFADDDGNAFIKLNSWEEGVLEEERSRSDFVCWLRNEVKQSWSLRIPYEMNSDIKTAYPDFIIIRSDPELGYVMDILEPHNPEFKDNLAKARAFSKYAEDEPRIGRIQLIRQAKDPAGKMRFKRLDMAKGAVRNKIMSAVTNEDLDRIFDTDGEFES